MATDREDLLDIKQAAQFLNVSETSLRRWTNDGRLACFRVGRKRERRFRRADLVAFLETQPVEGSHRCGLYQSDQGGAAQAAAFLGEGLGPRTISYVVATPPARERILAQLESRDASRRADRALDKHTMAIQAAHQRLQAMGVKTGDIQAAHSGALAEFQSERYNRDERAGLQAGY